MFQKERKTCFFGGLPLSHKCEIKYYLTYWTNWPFSLPEVKTAPFANCFRLCWIHLRPAHCRDDPQLSTFLLFKSDEIATLLFARWPSVVYDTGINKSWQRKLQNYIRQTLGNNYYPAGAAQRAEIRKGAIRDLISLKIDHFQLRSWRHSLFIFSDFLRGWVKIVVCMFLSLSKFLFGTEKCLWSYCTICNL